MQASDEKATGKRGPTGLGGDDAMDIDDEGGNSRTTRGSKRGPANFGFGMGRRLG
jgi:COP9 signalosome complex subunit 7